MEGFSVHISEGFNVYMGRFYFTDFSDLGLWFGLMNFLFYSVYSFNTKYLWLHQSPFIYLSQRRAIIWNFANIFFQMGLTQRSRYNIRSQCNKIWKWKSIYVMAINSCTLTSIDGLWVKKQKYDTFATLLSEK